MTGITISKEGRRFYLVGNTYAVKDGLRDAGAHWDRDRQAWWTSKPDVAEQFAGQANATAERIAEVRTSTANEERVAVTGNTYAVRDQLRALGGEWDGASKTWRVPASKAAAALALVGAAPKSSFRRGSSSRRSGGRWNGCSMGCRDGAPNPRCKSCCFDEYDC